MEMSYAVKGVALPLRFGALALATAACAAIQLALPGAGGVLLGLLVLVPALVLLWAKSFRNRPLDLGLEDWQPASAQVFGRIQANLAATRQGGWSPLQKAWPGLLLGITALVLAGVLGIAGTRLAALALLDVAVLLIPFTFSGNVRLWTPAQLGQRMASLLAVLAEEPEGGAIVITPYLRLDKDREGHQIPEDVRLMVEPRRKPEDFLGVQLQVAMNDGPNGSVPYLYAVFLCRGKGRTWRAIGALDFGRYIVEPGGDDEYGFVVVRQPTTGTGYHTRPDDCRNLYRMVREKLGELAA